MPGDEQILALGRIIAGMQMFADAPVAQSTRDHSAQKLETARPRNSRSVRR
jgi:hypothetical protein